MDIYAYNAQDVNHLLAALPDGVKDCIMISSSAVYPETNLQPFTEEQATGPNVIWGSYGTNKIEAEKALLTRMPHAYVLRPPYLCDPMQNVYREPFVFECAFSEQVFYIPKDGSMKLQLFHVEDLYKVMERILQIHPSFHVMNVGNETTVTNVQFVKLCYMAQGKTFKGKNVYQDISQREYFSFHDYEYFLDVMKQKELLPETRDLETGLRESFLWYIDHPKK